MAYSVRPQFGAGRSLMLPLRGSAYEQFLPIIQSAVNCLVLNASFLASAETITSLFKSEPLMIWSTVKNNILSTKWLFFSGTFKKTKYFGSQNSSNHLSEVAVEKKALWFSSCFLQIRNFLTRPLTLIETHYEITYLSLVDKFVLEVSKWWSMRSMPYVQQLKEKERKEKRLGEKAYIFTIGCSFEDNASQ